MEKVKKENSSALVATTSPHEVRKLVISKRLGSATMTCPSNWRSKTWCSKRPRREDLLQGPRRFCSTTCPAVAIVEWPRGRVCY